MDCISESDKNKQGSITAALFNTVGAARFELATSCSQSRRDNRATLRPVPTATPYRRIGMQMYV